MDVTKMNPAVKVNLIAALRSDEYEQTTGWLRVGDLFCCLGVVCNLHAIEHPEIAARQHSKDSYMGDPTNLPLEVMEWAGLSTDGEFKYENGESDSLASLNDSGKSFKQIASVIEKYF